MYTGITMQEVGKITHYYGKIGVAIIALSDALKVGDRIKIQGKHTDFEETVGSMEVEHRSVEAARGGDVIGLKVSEKAGEGSTVYKLEE